VIEFRDGPGPAVASVSRTLQPGTAPKDREWQEVSVSLPAGVTGKETLEFRYEAHGDSVVTGAWVQALLTPR
jgi:hypothetical protein